MYTITNHRISDMSPNFYTPQARPSKDEMRAIFKAYDDYTEARFKFKHRCSAMSRCDSIVFDRASYKWELRLDEYSPVIYFCPYCGEELLTPPAERMPEWDYKEGKECSPIHEKQ